MIGYLFRLMGTIGLGLILIGCGTEMRNIIGDEVSTNTETQQIADKSPEEIYRMAMAAYGRGANDQAMALFQVVFRKYPGHPLADNAQYWTGECLYAKGDYQGAMEAFKVVGNWYPGGNKAPDALLKIGYCYREMSNYSEALKVFKCVVADFPMSPAAEKARLMIRSLNENARQSGSG